MGHDFGNYYGARKYTESDDDGRCVCWENGFEFLIEVVMQSAIDRDKGAYEQDE